MLGLCDLRGTPATPSSTPARAWSAAASPSSATPSRDLRSYPQTLMFLLAYLFFNDGIQTVITSSSLYGAEQLQLRARAS